METTYDFAIVGAGPAGEAAAYLARKRGATVAIIDRELFGGSCPFWACMPSKTLLHAATVHARGGEYDWARASDRRDYMISREGTRVPQRCRSRQWPGGRRSGVFRGTGRIAGPGRVRVSHEGAEHTLRATHIIIAVGSSSTVPHIDGLETITPWTNREATCTRELPESLVVLGAGPTGVEMAQVFARYGVRTMLIASQPRVNPKDHPRNSAFLEEALRGDGVEVRTGVRAVRVVAATSAAGPHIGRAVGRIEGRGPRDPAGSRPHLSARRPGARVARPRFEARACRVGPDLRIADGVFVAGDPAGPEMHTHVAHYQGELAVRIALGDDVRPDYRAIPRAVYTDPEVAGVGLTLEQALEAGHDAFEEVADLATTAKGYVAEASGPRDHRRRSRRPARSLGAFIAGPAASEVIHEAVLAIKTGTTDRRAGRHDPCIPDDGTCARHSVRPGA